MEAIARACRANHVRNPRPFGSAATGDFQPDTSDIDLLVQFEVPSEESVLDAYVKLQTALEAIFRARST